jgi:hypothetical protein
MIMFKAINLKSNKVLIYKGIEKMSLVALKCFTQSAQS